MQGLPITILPWLRRGFFPSLFGPPLPVKPEFAGAADIFILALFVASGEQQDDLSPGDCVVDSLTRFHVDAQFPNTITAEFVIDKVAQLHPVDSAVNGSLCFCVAESKPPFHEDIFRISRQVMADFIHGFTIVYKRISVKTRLYLEAEIIK
jgi:hypothetical protein